MEITAKEVIDNNDNNNNDNRKLNRFKTCGLWAVLYGLIWTVCLYKNTSGIMTIVFAVATIAYLYLIIIRSAKSRADGYGVKDKFIYKPVVPYLVGILLLGASVFCTDDSFIIFMNYIGIYILAMTVLLMCFGNLERFGLAGYINSLIGMAVAPFKYIFSIFGDGFMYMRTRKDKASIIPYIALGIALALPLMALVIVMLSNADVVFKTFVEKGVNNLEISSNMVGFIVLLIVSVVYAYGVYCRVNEYSFLSVYTNQKNVEPVIGIAFSIMLTMVYVVFSGIQIITLFAKEHMLPDGYTYSEYARQGFFQLLFVAVINLVVVLICNHVFKDNKLLKIILTVMCGCTYIMIISSAVRITMYIKTYDLTYLRLLVIFALINLSCLFAGAIISIYNKPFNLVRYIIMICGVLYIILSFAHPDAIIARYNLDRCIERMENADEGEYDMDISYVLECSDDATYYVYKFYNELDRRSEVNDDNEIFTITQNECMSYFRDISFDYRYRTSDNKIRGFNLSRYRAYRVSDKEIEK